MTARILQGDAAAVLATLPSGSVHCCVTSPAYWGLRKYRAGAEEMGSEATPEEHIERLVAVFREAKRVLRDDGTLWLNYGDSYSSQGGPIKEGGGINDILGGPKETQDYDRSRRAPQGIPSLNLVGLPERLVLALQADGWVWRSTVCWSKPAPMPESLAGWAWEQHRVKVKPRTWTDDDTHVGDRHSGDVRNTDTQALWAPCPGCPACAPHDGLVLRRGSWRPTRAWEPIFMLTKGGGYYGDGEAVKTPYKRLWDETNGGSWAHASRVDDLEKGSAGTHRGDGYPLPGSGANLRNVWVLPPEPCNWDFCLACGTWYGRGGWARRSIRRWSTRELDVETEEYRTVQHRRCANCKAVDEFVDHYAAFPSELPRRCIAASTSERGVCPACGAPWARVIQPRSSSAHQGEGYTRGSGRNDGGGPGRYTTEGGNTLGWRATCDCNAGEPVAATVLDPFMGTATTLLAAARLGRDAIGIDLSERYCALATARLAADAPLLGMAPAGPTAPQAARKG